jgi:hypothetical protein
MGLVVEIDVICFSSCADYIFPAGRARVIRADAFVGWHGNERTFHVQAARDGKSLEDLLAQYVPKDASPEQRAAFFKDFAETTKVTLKDEADFYAKLGLNDAFAVCAVGDILEKRPGYAGQIGWGFSLADMARLGMTNTVYLGDGAYERPRGTPQNRPRGDGSKPATTDVVDRDGGWSIAAVGGADTSTAGRWFRPRPPVAGRREPWCASSEART